MRAEALAAHDPAVTAALDWFEAHGAVTRRGRDGVDQVDTRGITVATDTIAAFLTRHTGDRPLLHTI